MLNNLGENLGVIYIDKVCNWCHRWRLGEHKIKIRKNESLTSFKKY
jgi:hypothetical protein